jgi:hypothetical protein
VEAAVTVRVGRALLYLNDEATAAHFDKVWFDAAEHGRALPAAAKPRSGADPARHARAGDRRQRDRPPCAMSMVASDAPGGRPFLRVQLGRIAFEVRDLAAYRSCLGAFRQAHHLARDVFLPPGSERVLSGALAAARDAFFPEPAPPSSGRAGGSGR